MKKTYSFSFGDDTVSVEAKSEKKARKKLSKNMGYEWDRADWKLMKKLRIDDVIYLHNDGSFSHNNGLYVVENVVDETVHLKRINERGEKTENEIRTSMNNSDITKTGLKLK